MGAILVSLARLPEHPAEQFDAVMGRCLKGTFSATPVPGTRYASLAFELEPINLPARAELGAMAVESMAIESMAIESLDDYVGVASVGDICELQIRDGARTNIMTSTRPPRGSVFLVEDEVMIRMMVADMLDELGYTVAAEAGEIDEAMRLAQTTYFDLAILDVNVNGKVISPVADLIKARNRPFIFATGYGSSGLPEEYRDRPALQKPFQLETLGKMIDTALRSAAF